MGRKIPAKKHRGVKDPLQQQARRYQMLKTKINAPPKDPDEQPVPRSLTELFSRRGTAAAQKPKRKRRPALEVVDKSRGNPVSRLRKLPGESGRSFSLRINSAIRALHHSEEAQDYPQDDEEQDAKGARMARLRRKRRARAPRPAPRPAPPPAEAAAEAAAEAEAERRARPQYEHVAFGDVTAAPPALPAPRGAPPAADRPGRRTLLLSKLLQAGGGGGGGGAGAAGGGARQASRSSRAGADAAGGLRIKSRAPKAIYE